MVRERIMIMTDRDIIAAMLIRAGIEYDIHHNKDGTITLCIEGGYSGFYSTLTFNSDGSLKEVGAYE